MFNMKTSMLLGAVALTMGSLMAGEQLMNLPPAPNGGRFKTPADRVWPAKPGEANVCLWANDRYGACAITIDDNCQPDHEWWLKLTQEVGIKVTWFAVTGGIEKRGSKHMTFAGNWDDWQKLADAGHSIQSHTTNHKSDPPERNRKPDTKLLSEDDLVHMYKDSLDAINANVSNNFACCIAYPSGDAHPDVAGRYAIGCRGVYGVPSCANSINYLNTNIGGASKGPVEMVAFGKTEAGPKWIQDMKGLNRGLVIPLYHFVHSGHNAEEKAKNAERSEAEVRYIASLKDDRLWVCRFDDAMRYGQERDSATLTVKENASDKISFDLTDRMNDALFNFPLTVKIRLPEGWKTVKATQSGKPVEATVVEHDGAAFALVNAIPDRGETVLVPNLGGSAADAFPGSGF